MSKHFKQLPSRLHGLDATNPSTKPSFSSESGHFLKEAMGSWTSESDLLELPLVQNKTEILELRLIMGPIP